VTIFDAGAGALGGVLASALPETDHEGSEVVHKVFA
jgi:ketopantoate reductase